MTNDCDATGAHARAHVAVVHSEDVAFDAVPLDARAPRPTVEARARVICSLCWRAVAGVSARVCLAHDKVVVIYSHCTTVYAAMINDAEGLYNCYRRWSNRCEASSINHIVAPPTTCVYSAPSLIVRT